MALMRTLRTTMLLGLALVAVLFQQSCFIAQLAGAVGQNIERYKKIEVLAEYDGLRNTTVAVLVDTDMMVMYEYHV